MIYYIYHIAGIKIGVTKDLKRRMRDQRFTEWNILEEHTDIMEVSNREIQLQKDYGLPVDKIPYWKTHALVSDSNKGVATRRRNGTLGNSGLDASAIRKLTFEQAEEIRSKYIPRKYTYQKLSDEYGVSIRSIELIIKNLIYLK
tara:strand:+ start:77 stop:508 length:432 start_codon:yes stop_codon:yes gene_type:complete